MAKNNDFFIGYNDRMPPLDRRTMILAGGAGLLGVAFGGAKLAVHQRGWGSGSWDQGKIINLEGVVEQSPYPILRTDALATGGNGQMRSVSLVCDNKCGLDAQLAVFENKPVWVRGSLIKRGRHRLLAVVENEQWVGAATRDISVPAITEEGLGRVALNGEILDAKCWAGAMRPGEGKTHKMCASLCIRMGGTPWFLARDKAGKRAVFVLTGPKGEPLRMQILTLVGEPVRATGRLVRRDDLVQLRIDPATLQSV